MGALFGLLPFVVFFGLIVFGVIVSSIVHRLGSWNRIYEKTAKRYAGKVFPGYFLSRPSMSFDYGQSHCRVSNRKTLQFGEGRQTELTLQWPNRHWPDRKFKLDVTSNLGPEIKRRWQIKRAANSPVTLDDPPFDSKLKITSNNVETAERILTPAVQWQIELLRKHLGNQQLNININRGKLCIAKPTFIKDENMFDDFVRFSLSVYDQMMLTECEGIAFVAESSMQVIEDATCPICSESIEHQIVMCVRCKTPHCLDCWEYNGQCATFACNEVRCVTPDKLPEAPAM